MTLPINNTGSAEDYFMSRAGVAPGQSAMDYFISYGRGTSNNTGSSEDYFRSLGSATSKPINPRVSSAAASMLDSAVKGMEESSERNHGLFLATARQANLDPTAVAQVDRARQETLTLARTQAAQFEAGRNERQAELARKTEEYNVHKVGNDIEIARLMAQLNELSK